MKIVYFCLSGHWAAVAAAFHLCALPAARRPEPAEIAEVSYFGRLGRGDRGFLHPCGRDRAGNEIYIAGFGGHDRLARKAILSTARLFGLDPEQYVFIDCRPAAGLSGLAGERLWQWFWGPGRGRSALARLARLRSRGLADLAARVKGRAAP